VPRLAGEVVAVRADPVQEAAAGPELLGGVVCEVGRDRRPDEADVCRTRRPEEPEGAPPGVDDGARAADVSGMPRRLVELVKLPQEERVPAISRSNSGRSEAAILIGSSRQYIRLLFASRQEEFYILYSQRSAEIGSTRAARTAGTRAAATATIVIHATTPAILPASPGFSP